MSQKRTPFDRYCDLIFRERKAEWDGKPERADRLLQRADDILYAQPKGERRRFEEAEEKNALMWNQFALAWHRSTGARPDEPTLEALCES